jgi:hypothetical protein
MFNLWVKIAREVTDQAVEGNVPTELVPARAQQTLRRGQLDFGALEQRLYFFQLPGIVLVVPNQQGSVPACSCIHLSVLPCKPDGTLPARGITLMSLHYRDPVIGIGTLL